ncbi:MAG: c-type cytochrome [Ferruginibacter sp.]|nr:c-type cytochrome [Bacteroidota bacterium]MBX2917776.1 c-type cytochrome [Ferruginibacter sp.]MCB0709975.1 c-type cytochrome [Chitinophagaceae bacterium]
MQKSIFLLAGCVITIVTISSFLSTQTAGIKNSAQLGKKLFSEKILSKDSTVSCASCHKPQFAFADTAAFSVGIGGRLTNRNTPSVLNMKNRPYFFWDGRAASLEEQSLMPIKNPDEMGLPIDEAIKRLNEHTEYKKLFLKIFKEQPNAANLANAFAAYEQTLETVNSKFDDWSNGKIELTASEERGRQLFIGDKAKCFDCHRMEDFTDDEFKNIGLYNGKELNDAGLYNITKKESDLGKFKTPGLRNIAVTAPYMHNGKFKTLEQVLTYYNNPDAFVEDPVNIDDALKKPLGLSLQDKKDIIAFLKTLTDKKYIAK